MYTYRGIITFGSDADDVPHPRDVCQSEAVSDPCDQIMSAGVHTTNTSGLYTTHTLGGVAHTDYDSYIHMYICPSLPLSPLPCSVPVDRDSATGSPGITGTCEDQRQLPSHGV